ncbi:MAG: thiolase family protein [Deltaproteobacteria bacterium]|nr:thiolase family protein [Deltaproteobacteria bacterium]
MYECIIFWMDNVVISWAKRTPIGSFGGVYRDVDAIQLGVKLVNSLMKDMANTVSSITDLILGNVLSAGLGQNPAKQIIIKAGLSNSTQSLTVNKVCSSSLEALRLAYNLIKTNQSKCVLVGGVESMSKSPHLIRGLRFGVKYGAVEVSDHMLIDGLINPYDGLSMGQCCETGVTKYGFRRDELDDYAILSYKRAQEANSTGQFQNEIVPVFVNDQEVVTDEEPFRVDFGKIPNLKPVFAPNGCLTAANSSKLSDGACFALVSSLEVAVKLGLRPMAEIVAFGRAATSPQEFYSAPVSAILDCCGNSNIKSRHVKVFEINEAFSCVPLIALMELDLPLDIVNVRGGGISLGHPLGVSGIRIVTTLINIMRDFNLDTGCAAICNGGGEAVAVMLKLFK